MRHLTGDGLALIKRFEGFIPTALNIDLCDPTL